MAFGHRMTEALVYIVSINGKLDYNFIISPSFIQ